MYRTKSKLIYIVTFIICAAAVRPTQNQLAFSVSLSKLLKDGVDNLNTKDGCVINSYKNGQVSKEDETYAIWKNYKTKDCYIVVKGEDGVMASIKSIELQKATYDEEIKANVRAGTRATGVTFTDSINLSNKLKECKRDIIITGHGSGGSIAHYLFLSLAKKHYKNTTDGIKGTSFKGVLFGSPLYITQTQDESLKDLEKNIEYYEYEGDGVPSLVKFVKAAFTLQDIVRQLLKIFGIIDIPVDVYKTVKDVPYGDYYPGNYFILKKLERRNQLLFGD